MTPLGEIILTRWPNILARYPPFETRNGVSVTQVAKHIGARHYSGAPTERSNRSTLLLPIVKTLGWLARRGLLVSQYDAKDRRRFSVTELGMSYAIKSGMSGQVTQLEVIQQFFQPSVNSTTVTLVSKKTGIRFTYDIKRRKPNADGHADEVWYVDLLSGPDNRTDYSALAVLTKQDGRLTYHHARASRISNEAPSARAFKWALERLVVAGDTQAQNLVEVWHEGRCGRCGRKLTVPASIELGLGPECAEKL
ncbi:hypothetical protein Rctr197k_166 [Virus Rctr197k]|nr:hypothetical protein Rctr197k_166 [Virus Rctr197k]